MNVQVERSKIVVDKEIDDDVGLDKQMESKKNSEEQENMSKKDESEQLTAQEILAKINAKEGSEELKDSSEHAVSLKFGVIGCGHAGSRIAEVFYDLGYNAIAMNTATQDLVHINLPEEQKLFLDIGIQGAAKDLARGEEAATQYRKQIQDLIYNVLGSSQVIVVCSSTSGGSGAGSLPMIIDLLQDIGKPIVVIGILPMISEDVKAKTNALDTLAVLSENVRDGKIHNLICIDNARIEAIYDGISQMDFYKVANKAIVESLEVFNKYSLKPSDVKALDSAEFATMLLNGEGLSIYGQITINNYEDDIAIAQAVMSGLEGNLLASGFELKEARFVGFMVIANNSVWKKVPAGAINYASTMINDAFGNPEGSYKGIYEGDDPEEVVKVYTFVSGLGLPRSRIEGLKGDVATQQATLKTKNEERAKKLDLDRGKDDAVLDVDKIKQKITAKTKGFGKLTNLVVDRRKR